MEQNNGWTFININYTKILCQLQAFNIAFFMMHQAVHTYIANAYNVFSAQHHYINGMYYRIDEAAVERAPLIREFYLLMRDKNIKWRFIYRNRKANALLWICFPIYSRRYRWFISSPNSSQPLDALIKGKADSLYLITGDQIVITVEPQSIIEILHATQQELTALRKLHNSQSSQNQLQIMRQRIRYLEHELCRKEHLNLSVSPVTTSRLQNVSFKKNTFWIVLVLLVLMVILFEILIVWYCRHRDHKRYQLQQMKEMIKMNTMLRERVSVVLENVDELDEGDIVTITDPWMHQSFEQSVIDASVTDDIVTEMIMDVVNK